MASSHPAVRVSDFTRAWAIYFVSRPVTMIPPFGTLSAGPMITGMFAWLITSWQPARCKESRTQFHKSHRSDVGRIFAQLAERGVEVVLKPQDIIDWGLRDAYLCNLAGHLITLSGALDRPIRSEFAQNSVENLPEIPVNREFANFISSH